MTETPSGLKPQEWPDEWVNAVLNAGDCNDAATRDMSSDHADEILKSLRDVGAIAGQRKICEASGCLATARTYSAYCDDHFRTPEPKPAVTVGELAKVIGVEQYAFALSVSSDPVLRAVTRAQVMGVFQSAWNEDTGDVRSIGLLAAQALLERFDVVRKKVVE